MTRSVMAGKRAYIIVLFTIAELPMYLLLKLLITYILVTTGLNSARSVGEPMIFIRNSAWRFFYFLCLSTGYSFGRLSVARAKKISELDKQRLQSQLNEQELEKNLLSSENAFLKAQINQHFLFNMLSFIHSNVLKYSEKIGDLIISLSDLMRYAFTEPDADGKVRLAGEVEHIENYLSLNQHRFNHQLNFDFKATGDIDNVRVISLLLVTIIENVFKYGDLQNPAYPAKIHINADGNKLHLHVDNSKLKRPHGHSSGIGMDNVQKRLELMYPGNYKLNINQDTETYQLDLNINIPENDLLHH
ncbi:histidine kinase [Mucilaginibacter mali]|uniref:Histidine kinase n=1 Tax=Mucilaginibacter mali TaxID=2740462 RepID=A0A7D4QHG3_9SPHI|nr:histidine kinase [Mucilaginibacter mali]QKJ28330.1 histidine kinase [Mucilaginibacter mali]